MTERAKLQVTESKEQIVAYEKDLEELQKELQSEIEELHDKWAAVAQEFEEFQVRPRRADVQIAFLGLGWRPVKV
jgi:peptidoglycan hydrolase CwlO-like protein